jgi:hypothetical protein
MEHTFLQIRGTPQLAKTALQGPMPQEADIPRATYAKPERMALVFALILKFHANYVCLEHTA